uniref:Putative ovule protein n=1 Tax=Solanum chacoense TaxID=4108 RepID=A0A0V0INJ3_SOLCH
MNKITEISSPYLTILGAEMLNLPLHQLRVLTQFCSSFKVFRAPLLLIIFIELLSPKLQFLTPLELLQVCLCWCLLFRPFEPKKMLLFSILRQLPPCCYCCY